MKKNNISAILFGVAFLILVICRMYGLKVPVSIYALILISAMFTRLTPAYALIYYILMAAKSSLTTYSVIAIVMIPLFSGIAVRFAKIKSIPARVVSFVILYVIMSTIFLLTQLMIMHLEPEQVIEIMIQSIRNPSRFKYMVAIAIAAVVSGVLKNTNPEIQQKNYVQKNYEPETVVFRAKKTDYDIPVESTLPAEVPVIPEEEPIKPIDEALIETGLEHTDEAKELLLLSQELNRFNKNREIENIQQAIAKYAKSMSGNSYVDLKDALTFIIKRCQGESLNEHKDRINALRMKGLMF